MRILLFDIDGTLIDCGGTGRSAMDETLLTDFDIPELLVKVDLAGRTDRVIAHDYLARHDLPHDDASVERFLDGYLRRLRVNLPKRSGRVLPGVAPLLATLGPSCGDSVHLGLLTGNIVLGARAKLDHYGLSHFFFTGANGAIPRGGFGDGALDRNDIAAAAWRRLVKEFGPGVAPGDVWVIGDTPRDVRCARSIGAHCLGVATGGASCEELTLAGATATLADCSDVAKAVEILLG